jgi:hypothetical protein
VAQETIVIITFLFLTMTGTPESRLLREKLRLHRPDIEYLSLDRLETFLSPDILRDEELVALLEESGCGSLLNLARSHFPYEVLKERAREIRQFLRLPDKPNQKQLKGFTKPAPGIP